jgi:hypothetical protein
MKQMCILAAILVATFSQASAEIVIRRAPERVVVPEVVGKTGELNEKALACPKRETLLAVVVALGMADEQGRPAQGRETAQKLIDRFDCIWVPAGMTVVIEAREELGSLTTHCVRGPQERVGFCYWVLATYVVNLRD